MIIKNGSTTEKAAPLDGSVVLRKINQNFQIQLKIAIMKISKFAASQVLYERVISGFVPVNNPTTNGKVLQVYNTLKLLRQ